MNRAYCNKCLKLAPTDTVTRDGKVFLVKNCPDCGVTETLISSDAKRYQVKRDLDHSSFEFRDCALNCMNCKHGMPTSFVFVDITNRCNLNCPICINNTPSMGFLFEPPLEYFDRLFEELGKIKPAPPVQLFGGEPTVRKDLFEIIDLAKSYGLPTRVVTNGIKLADEEYCRKLAATRSTILIAYDGSNPETYRVLRGSEKILKKKIQALDNLAKIKKAKVGIMTCIGKGFNDNEILDILDFCHKRRNVVRGVYFMPLAHTWDDDTLQIDPERMTTEDLEMILQQSFPGERLDFLPAGIMGQISTLMKYLAVKPIPFAGAHPNCESFYMLVSDGERYLPITRYFHCSLPEMINQLYKLEDRLKKRSKGIRESLLADILRGTGVDHRRTMTFLMLISALRPHVKWGALFPGRGLKKIPHIAAALAGVLLGRKTAKYAKHMAFGNVLQVIVLPFEDMDVLETERLERCPNSFGFYDPETDKIGLVPVCAWSMHKTEVMKRLADYYTQEAAKI